MKQKKSSMPYLFSMILILIVFFSNCAVSTQPPGEKTYELKYSLEKGTKVILTSTGDVNSVSDQMGTEVVVDIFGSAEDIYVVLSSDRDKGLHLELEYGERSQDVDSMQGSNSTDFSELIGKKVKFFLSPIGKADNFEGFDSLPVITTAAADQLDEETYTLGAKTTFPLLPDRPVKIGDSWTDAQNMDIPTGGYVLNSENIFTYTLLEEIEKDGFDCLKIGIKGTSRLSGDFEQAGTPLSIDRETTTTGTLYFAYKEGMFISSETESIAEGLILVPQAGIEIPQSLVSKGTVTVRMEK